MWTKTDDLILYKLCFSVLHLAELLRGVKSWFPFDTFWFWPL